MFLYIKRKNKKILCLMKRQKRQTMNVDQLFTKRKLESEPRQALHPGKHPRYLEDNDFKILELIKQDENNLNFEVEKYDSSWLTKTLAKVDKAIVANADLRSKHKDDPSKFLDSEFELNECIKLLSGLGLVEDNSVVEEFCTNKTTITLIALMKTHPNMDISNQVISIINELIGREDDGEGVDDLNIELFSPLFVRTKFTYILCDHIIKLEKRLQDVLLKQSVKLELLEDISAALDLLIKLTEFPDLNKFLVDDKKLIKFVLSKIEIDSPSEVNEISQSYSEVLTSLVSETANTKISRIDKLLQNYNIVELLLINFSKFVNYKKQDKIEVEEYIENLIDTLCYLLNISVLAKQQFLQNEGLELLFLVFSKDNKWAISRSFKILANTMNTNDEVSLMLAPLIITKGGLKYLFKNLNKRHRAKDVIRIISSLFRLLELDSNERIRLFNKLIDKDHCNFQKLLQLREQYETSINEQDDELVQIEMGKETLQHLHVILAWCLVDEVLKSRFDPLVPKTVKTRIEASLKTQVEELESTIDSVVEAPTDLNTLSGATIVNARETVEMLRVLLDGFDNWGNR